jgi:hypothetical protein
MDNLKACPAPGGSARHGDSAFPGGNCSSENAPKAAGTQAGNLSLRLSPLALETLTRPACSYGLGFGPAPSRARLATALRKQRSIVLEQLAYNAAAAADSNDWGNEANIVYYSREAWFLIHRLAEIIVDLRQREGRVV